VTRLEEAASKPEHERTGAGLSTGYRDLDYRTGGLNPGNLIVVASRPAMGKSALANNIAMRMSQRENRPSLCFQLEMSSDQVVGRQISDVSSVDAGVIRTGTVNPAEMSMVRQAHEKLREIPMLVDTRPMQTMATIMSRSRRLQDRLGDLALIVIDYVQLVTPSNTRISREQQVAEMSRKAKLMAKELGVPVMLLAQLSREVEKRTSKKPQLSDLRESGAIEQDADQVWFPWRPEVYWPNDPRLRKVAKIIVAKNRDGVPGVVEMRWEGRYQRFRDMTMSEIAQGATEIKSESKRK